MNNLDTIISNDAWDALSLAEKAEMMRVAVNNGITNLQEIRKQYNEFAEGGDTESSWTMQDEANYRQWRNSLPDNLRDTNDNDYDMRGAFEANMQPILESDGKYHLQSRDPKTGRILKAPHHPTYIQAINTDARMGYYPIVDGKGQTYTQTWKGNLFGKGGSKDDDLVDWIIREEGFSTKPENIGDGKITLGSGLTNPKWHQLYKKRGNKWSASDNRKAVQEEVANRRRWAEKNVPNWDYLPDSSQKALLSYKYNYDFNRTNSPKLFQALADHNYTEAARQMNATSKDSKFKKGLQERRKREQKWFLNDFMETTPTASPATSSTPTVPSFDVVFTEPAASTNIFNPYVQQVTNTQYVPLREPASDSYIETVEVTPEEQRRRKLQQVMEAHTRFNNIMELIRPRREKIPQFIPDNFLDNYNIGYSRGGKIYIKPSHRGKFTALKERTGHSATWFKQHGTPTQKKMATFALNARHWKHGLGGNLFDGGEKKGFVDNTIDFTYDVDFDRLRVNPETGEVYQQSLPKGAVILPELEVKGKELTAVQKVNQLLENLPKEKGLENPEFDPFLMGATAGKLSGDLIGDALGLGFNKSLTSANWLGRVAHDIYENPTNAYNAMKEGRYIYNFPSLRKYAEAAKKAMEEGAQSTSDTYLSLTGFNIPKTKIRLQSINHIEGDTPYYDEITKTIYNYLTEKNSNIPKSISSFRRTGGHERTHAVSHYLSTLTGNPRLRIPGPNYFMPNPTHPIAAKFKDHFMRALSNHGKSPEETWANYMGSRAVGEPYSDFVLDNIYREGLKPSNDFIIDYLDYLENTYKPFSKQIK